MGKLGKLKRDLKKHPEKYITNWSYYDKPYLRYEKKFSLSIHKIAKAVRLGSS